MAPRESSAAGDDDEEDEEVEDDEEPDEGAESSDSRLVAGTRGGRSRATSAAALRANSTVGTRRTKLVSLPSTRFRSVLALACS